MQNVRDWHANLRELLRRQAVQERNAQLESDELWNIQPVQFVVDFVRQTLIELPCRTSDDSAGGVDDPLQLARDGRSSRRVS